MTPVMMIRSIALVCMLAVGTAVASAQTPAAPPQDHVHDAPSQDVNDHADHAAPPQSAGGHTMEGCQMMAESAAINAEFDVLLEKWNAATGDEKIPVMTDMVAVMQRQRALACSHGSAEGGMSCTMMQGGHSR